MFEAVLNSLKSEDPHSWCNAVANWCVSRGKTGCSSGEWKAAAQMLNSKIRTILRTPGENDSAATVKQRLAYILMYVEEDAESMLKKDENGIAEKDAQLVDAGTSATWKGEFKRQCRLLKVAKLAARTGLFVKAVLHQYVLYDLKFKLARLKEAYDNDVEEWKRQSQIIKGQFFYTANAQVKLEFEALLSQFLPHAELQQKVKTLQQTWIRRVDAWPKRFAKYTTEHEDTIRELQEVLKELNTLDRAFPRNGPVESARANARAVLRDTPSLV